MDLNNESLKLHEKLKGKLEIKSKVPINTANDLSLLYTPGVAEPCKKIAVDKNEIYKYTMKGNTVAVVTDGTAVLGLGDIGPYAALPVMEGKAALFKEFANINAVPICLDTTDSNLIVETVKLLAPGFGGINLEDISAPRCFEIEEKLKNELNIPVFHDDQHGTAIVVLAGIINSLKIVKKTKSNVKIVINGAGSAGIAICKLLLNYGFTDIILCDKMGIVYEEADWANEVQQNLAHFINPSGLMGNLKDAIVGADIFIGVSAPNILTEEMVKSMNTDSVIFAMANPTPEILPEIAKEAGARIVGTGRSDYPNQINNVLVFPGIFKGALEAKASKITEEMKIASAKALASMIDENELNEENILPKAFSDGVADVVAQAVIKCSNSKIIND